MTTIDLEIAEDYYEALADVEAIYPLSREDRYTARLALGCTLLSMAHLERPAVVLKVLEELKKRLSEEVTP